MNEDTFNRYYFIDNYRKFGLTYCTNRYGGYSTIAEAIVACDLDSECKGIFDNFCDGTGFTLCPSVGEYENSTKSCTYRKGNISNFVTKLGT